MSTEERAGAAPIYNIVGDLVALGPLVLDPDGERLHWANDFRTIRGYDPPYPMTAEHFQRIHDLTIAGKRVVFTLYERATARLIGHAGLQGIDPRNRSAELNLFVGAPDARGKGYGTEATQLVLDYAFTALGLHSACLWVYAFNLAAIRAYEKAGLCEAGRRRESAWMGDRFWDEILMECLARDFTSPVLGRVFTPDAPRPS